MKNDRTAPKHIAEAAKWRLFDVTVRQVRNAFRDLPSRKLNRLIDEAVAFSRGKAQRT